MAPKFSPQFTFNWRNRYPASTGRSTIKFGQAMIQPITHMPPAMDYTFFKKPLPINVLTSPKGWETPGAISSPMSKVPPKLSLDDLDTTKSMVDLAILIEDDDDETFAPHKTDSSKSRETHGSSSGRGHPLLRKHATESPASWKTLKLKSCKTSCTSWDEWEECDESRKEPEYKEMCYLTFAPVTELE